MYRQASAHIIIPNSKKVSLVQNFVDLLITRPEENFAVLIFTSSLNTSSLNIQVL